MTQDTGSANKRQPDHSQIPRSPAYPSPAQSPFPIISPVQVDQTKRAMQLMQATPEALSRIDEILDGKAFVVSPLSGSPPLLTLSAAARLMGISRMTLWRMFKDGVLARVELRPGCYRIRRADLEAIAAGNAVRQ